MSMCVFLCVPKHMCKSIHSGIIQPNIGINGKIGKPTKAMAPHSSTLAWKIPWTEEPGGLHSMGALGVRHD